MAGPSGIRLARRRSWVGRHDAGFRGRGRRRCCSGLVRGRERVIMETGVAAVTYTPRSTTTSTTLVHVSHLSRLLDFSGESVSLLEERRSFANSVLGRQAFFHSFRLLLSPWRKAASTSAMEALLPVEDRESWKVVWLVVESASLRVGFSTTGGPREGNSRGNMLKSRRILAIYKMVQTGRPAAS